MSRFFPLPIPSSNESKDRFKLGKARSARRARKQFDDDREREIARYGTQRVAAAEIVRKDDKSCGGAT